ncbi:uncharacterized protein LOC128956585 [Oppia nitens]|uniref:uncharacterized protein LOC128956585 n=1 Tax=Oppia nitens TaxID=1686743 RepID=UPI0023DC392B|nr:uncharacterized protein LOC128956585 [Oppia nitens]
MDTDSIVSMDHLLQQLLADCPNNQPINQSVSSLIDDDTALVKQLMIACVGGYYYYCRQQHPHPYLHPYLHPYHRQQQRQQIIGQSSTNSLSTRPLSSSLSATLLGQWLPILRIGYTIIEPEDIDRLRKQSAPMYVAVMGWDGSRGTGCIVGHHHHRSVMNTDTFTVRVLTCAHAVCLQLPVQVYGIRISGPTGQTGRVVLMDPGLDLALVEISVDSAASILNFQWLPTTADGAFDGQLFGQPVLAFGFPTDSYNLCTGLVSCPAGQRFAEENYRHFAAARHVDLTSQHLHYPIPDQQSCVCAYVNVCVCVFIRKGRHI